ncbi:MAG: hypothetical protein WC822_02060 [Candidatus Paceibacterota bacterium]|jgi:hypothetical protein
MSKILLQDMVKVKTFKKEITKEQIPNLNQFRQNNKKSKYRIYFVALLSVVFLLFALSFLFSKATISISPKVQEIPLNENLSATKDSDTSALPFNLVVLSGEENKTIQGGGEKDVAIPAKGTVIIYNSYNSSSQTLDIDTRLEGSNGKIYKTSKKITVPGMKDDKPGNVEVEIYASVAGIEYNSTPLDFKIFGFKGTPKYSKFYARSKGDITGGFKGKSPIVSTLDQITATNELKATLKDKLLKKVTSEIPNGFILFKDAIFFNIEEKNINYIPNKDNTMSVNMKGTLYGFLFDEQKLVKKIAEDVVEKYNGEEIYIPNIKDLVFSLSDKENVSFGDVKSINFNLSGSPKIIWKVDENKFITDILNKKKKDFNQILSQYPSISSADLVIRPFWKSSFPEKSKNIEVIVNYPE